MIKSSFLAFAALFLCIALTGTHAKSCKCSVVTDHLPDKRDLKCTAENGAQAHIQAVGLKDKKQYPLRKCVQKRLKRARHLCKHCSGGDEAVKCSKLMKLYVESNCHA